MGIRLKDVRMVFRGAEGQEVPVLNVSDLSFEKGRHVCLVGASGQGKTTLLNIIAGIVRPSSGQVLFDDVDITTLSEHARDRFRARHVGYVFQTFNLLQGLTALENVMLAQSFAGVKGRAARERAESLLRRIGLGHRLGARPSTLSVGEQQRVALARAVVNHPRVVLADEPTANLDEAHGDEVVALLREVTAEEGTILLLATHESRIRASFEDVLLLSELAA